MASKALRIPIVGDDVLFHMNGVLRPAKVVVGGDSQSTYIGLTVLTASDVTPGGVHKYATVFYAYAPNGTENGKWQWPEELDMKRITVELNEAGQVVGDKSDETPAAPEVTAAEDQPVPVEAPKSQVGVGGALSPESNLGKIIDLQLQTIRAATSKLMAMKKNGRLTIGGSDADVEQYQTMIEAIGRSEVELRSVLFGV